MLIDPQAYAKIFVGLTMPPELMPLLDFYNSCGPDLFSQGFEMEIAEEVDYALTSYSENPQFTNAFRKIGQSTGSGSLYYFWRQDGISDLGAVPIVNFGDEGGMNVVATNFRQLLQNLTCDCECRSAYNERFAEAGEEPSGQAAAYCKWLLDNYGITAIDGQTANRDNVKPAQAQYGQAFKDWLLTFGINSDNYG